MAPKLPPMGMAGLTGLTGVPTGAGGPQVGPSTPIGPMNAEDADYLASTSNTNIRGIPGRGGAPTASPLKVGQPKPPAGSASVFAPFGFDSKGNPITTPPPGWKYFNWDGTPVAPAPATGGWSEADRAQTVWGPEAQAPDFADTGGEGADMYEMGLIPQDQIFLPVGAKLNVPLTPESKVKPNSKVGKVSMRRSGGKIAR